MAIRPDDIVPISEAAARIQELFDDAVAGTKHVLTNNDGTRRVVMVEADRLERLEQLESSSEGAFSLKEVALALEEAKAGKKMSLEEYRRRSQARVKNLKEQAKEIIDAKAGTR
jgi:PHD/YefM family antitoxin component YafN of YafNO toxin-antitoxin module